MHAFHLVVAGDHPGDVARGRKGSEHLFTLPHLDVREVEAGVRRVEVAPPLQRFFQPVTGQRIEQAEAVMQLLAVIDHCPLHREHVLGLHERHRAAVLEHQIGRHQKVDVIDPLQRLQPARSRPLLPDEVVRCGVESALRRDVDDVGGATAVVEEAAHRMGHVAVAGAEYLFVLLEGAHPRRLMARTCIGGAEERGDAGLHPLQRDVAVAGGLDVNAGRFVEAHV